MTQQGFEPWLAEARALHRETPVFVPYIEHYGGVFKASGQRQCDVEKLDAAGIRTFGAAVGHGPHALGIGPGEVGIMAPDDLLYERVNQKIDRLLSDAGECPRARQVRRVSELRPPPGDDTLRFFILSTGQRHYRTLEDVEYFFRRGLRAAHLAGDKFIRGIFVEKADGVAVPPITEYGRQVVARMNEIGIVIDTAHMSDEAVIEIARITKKPIFDGHTCSRDLVPSSRGLNDQALRAIAGTGGCVGIHFADHMLAEFVNKTKYAGNGYNAAEGVYAYHRHVLTLAKDPVEVKRLRDDAEGRARFLREHGYPPVPTPGRERVVTVAHMADHIEYLVNLIGIDHVGLGGDINGIGDDQWPVGMDHVGELPHLTAELLRRGWKREALKKFLSENWYRVFEAGLPE